MAQQRKPQTTKKKTTGTAPRPRRREVGALVCLFLALIASLGYFNVSALFIDFFCGLMKGLLGYGYWLVPPALLACGATLAFHRGRPVRLRVVSALLVPVFLGAFIHLLASDTSYSWGWSILSTLYKSGKIMHSGGVINGILAESFTSLFSKAGSIIIFIVATLFFALTALNYSLSELIEKYKNRPRLEYDPEPEPKQQPVKRRQTKGSIDIPLDDPQEPADTPARPPRYKTGFFNRKPGAIPPDQFSENEPPQAELSAFPEHNQAPFPPEPSLEPEEKILPPNPIPIERVPLSSESGKIKSEDIALEKAAVSREISQNLSEKAPYRFPSVSLLKSKGPGGKIDGREEMALTAQRLEGAIRSFGVNADISHVTRGPSVTRYELELEQGVKLNKLTNLSDDIALSLGVTGVRIAPVPDKISMVGIEVPNKLVSTVFLREIIESPNFQGASSKISFALGKDLAGEALVCNIAKLPHLLIAGTTGSGKSVCMNSIILSLLYKAKPEELRFIMIDPKMVELGIYNGIPHLLIPVVTDPKKAAGSLQWAVTEMTRRYKLFSELGVRDLFSYNTACAREEGRERLPQIVIVIDELADLMIVAAKEVEESIVRIASMARAAGMHLVIATQRPSADVITGLMKANIPSRIAFAVASGMESRIILDTQGAEKLVGKGDMLYYPLGAGKPARVQGCFVSDEEREEVVAFVKQEGTADYSADILNQIEQNAQDGKKGGDSIQPEKEESCDEFFNDAVIIILESGQASVSMLQRRLKLGYSRAARLVDQMEKRGIVGPFEGSKPRQLLITRSQWYEMQKGQIPEHIGATGPAPWEAAMTEGKSDE